MVRRITTNGTMYSYKSTLQRTYRGLADTSNKVMTTRRFNSYSEDPAAASRAFQLRRAVEHRGPDKQQRRGFRQVQPGLGRFGEGL